MMTIAAIVTILLIYILIYHSSRSFIRAIANTWLAVTAFVWTATELFSVFRLYTRRNMILAWLLLLVVLVVLLYKRGIKNIWRECIAENPHYKELWQEYKVQILAGLAFAVLILLGSALHSLNNTDSSIYHLPRIMHWIANQSVWPYAAGKDLQIRYPSLTEFLVAQIFLMGLPERMASLVQAGAFWLSGTMIYGISRRMNVRGKTSFFGVFVFYCSPIALSQAFTTQTDNVAAMFLLVYLYFLMDFIQSERLAGGWGMVRNGVRLAAVVIFGFLCKPTICFAMVVFFIWMCIVRIWKRDKILLLLGYLAVAAVTVVLLYTPLLARTYDIYYSEHTTETESEKNPAAEENKQSTDVSSKAGNVLAPDAGHVFSSSNSPKKIFMTLMMNYSRSSSSIVFPKWNILLKKFINWTGERLNCDVSMFAIQEGEGFFHHDTASSPVVLLGMLLMCILLLAGRCRLQHEQRCFILCSIFSFVIQCALMTYTLYRGRYLVGVIAVLCIAFNITADNLKVREKAKGNALTGIMVLAAIGGINTLSCEAFNIRDGLTSRHVHQYLVNNTWLEEEFSALFDYINEKGYRNIGLYGGFTYEYIAWREVKDLERLEVVNVQYPEYRKYEDMDFHPDCIIRDDTAEPEETIECHGREYKLVWSIPAYLSKFAVYAPE